MINLTYEHEIGSASCLESCLYVLRILFRYIKAAIVLQKYIHRDVQKLVAVNVEKLHDLGIVYPLDIPQIRANTQNPDDMFAQKMFVFNIPKYTDYESHFRYCRINLFHLKLFHRARW